MTVIKLDTATLAKVSAGDMPHYLGDETGVPKLRIAVTPITPPDREPTEVELDEAEKNPVD